MGENTKEKDNAIVSLANVDEDNFRVEFEIMPVDKCSELMETRNYINQEIAEIDGKIDALQQKLDSVNKEISRLTNDADSIDYAIAVTCGVITGIFDSIVVGEWNFAEAKAEANKDINKRVLEFAKKDPDYEKFIDRKRTKKDANRLENAIQFLEDKYKLPGDGAYQNYRNLGITDKTHHLDDFCHHPTLVGLACCILVQFTGIAQYTSSTGHVVDVPIEVNEYGNIVSKEQWGKVFAGIINWFFNVAKTLQNREGHLFSDMAGSITSAGKGNEGAGVPGSLISIAKELSSLECFRDKDFGENLRKAYQNGIGTKKSQVDLGAFNSLFEGASSKFDMRTELAVGNELKRQAFPVILNEVMVRGVYFIRRFISELKAKGSLKNLNWSNIWPVGNRTIVRMMTIASGTFTAIDMADAAIRSAVKSGGVTNPAFLSNMVLRVNFPGVGRFIIALGTDVGMGIKRNKLRSERIALYKEQIAWTNVKVFYKEADMWISANDAGIAIEEAYDMMEKTSIYYIESMNEINDNLLGMRELAPRIKEKNPDFFKLINDTYRRK